MSLLTSAATEDVETQTARALMLRCVIEHARFIDDFRQMLWVPRREAIMPAGLNVQQFVEWISVGHPRRSFLIGHEQVAIPVEGHANGEANAGAYGFTLREVGQNALNRAALHRRFVARLA